MQENYLEDVIYKVELWDTFQVSMCYWPVLEENYRKVSNIRCTESQNLNVSHLGLQLSLRNILKPSIKWRMKM